MRVLRRLSFTLIPLLAIGSGISADASKSGQLCAPQRERVDPTEETTEGLISKLHSDNEQTRLDAVLRLSLLRSDAAFSALRAAASDTSEGVRAAAITGLGKSGNSAFVPAIARALSGDKSVLVRKSAAYALGRLSGHESTSALSGALRDKDKEVRAAAIIALAEHRDPSSIGALITKLSDSDPFVREQAARALGRYGAASKAATPTLIEILMHDREGDVRVEAAKSLGEIADPDPAAVIALERAAQDTDPYLSRAAHRALQAIRNSKE